MRADSIFIPLVMGFLCTVSVSSAIPKDPFLGIAPEDEKYYQSDTIACRDGSNKFTRAQLNDDFCDCPDATDEPGTSACPGGYFYCRNLGHTPLKLFSSRVNDGICDCCDGSDEYDGTVECPNTCWEAGKAARDKLTKKVAIYQEGVTIRKRGIEQAKFDMAKDEAKLSKLKSEENILKGLVQQLKERKEQIEKAEEKERLEKEKEEREKKEAEENANKEAEEGKIEAMEKADIKDKPLESTFDDIIGNVQDSPSEQVSQHKEQIEKAEEKERLEKENEEKEKKEAEENANKEEAEEGKSEEVEKADIKNKPSENTLDDKNGNVEDSPSEQHEGGREKTVLPEVSKEGAAFESESDIDAISKGKESPDEVEILETDASEDTKALSSEELGRLVASRWTGENTGKQGEEGDLSKDNNHNEDDGDMPEETHDDDYDNYASDTDDDSSRYGSDDDDDVEDDIDDDFARTHDPSSSYEADFSEIAGTPSWLEKIQQTVQNLLQAVNPFQTPVDKSEAELVRKEYEESSAQLLKIESRVSKLTKKLGLDFGPEKEFYSFYGRCFEGKQNKYIYKVCPYKQASQIETHSTTGLGYWDKFEDVNKAMVFSNGYKCWNGPDRSLKVKLRCGLKNEITDVDEPSRCEYVAVLSTPAVCSEEKLKELQDKLEWMKKEQPHSHSHDEL